MDPWGNVPNAVFRLIPDSYSTLLARPPPPSPDAPSQKLTDERKRNEDTGSGQIPHMDHSQMTPKLFSGYMERNEPIVIHGLPQDWKSFKEWNKPEDETRIGTAALDQLKSEFGKSNVCVAICSEKHFSDQKRINMRFADYIELWKSGEARRRKMYVKDWHFPREYPEYNAYNVPEHFRDDWMNRYATETGSDDFRFLYIGPEGTWTPLHRDVYCSYSWSANVVGYKLWILFPPSATSHLVDKTGNCVYNISDTKTAKEKRFQESFSHFKEAIAQRRMVLQPPDSVIFVPSGWYHQVYNITDVISINHNWFNGWSLPRVFKHMQDEMQIAKETLEGFQFDSFTELNINSNQERKKPEVDTNAVQQLMKANTGIDCRGFVDLLCFASDWKLNDLTRLELQEHGWKHKSAAHALSQLETILSEIEKCWAKSIDKTRLSKLNNVRTKICSFLKNVITKSS